MFTKCRKIIILIYDVQVEGYYDVQVEGYVTPKDTQILVNVWAFSRESILICLRYMPQSCY